MLHPNPLGVALLLAAALPAALQEPKPGSAWYEDAVDLGFKVKAPKDWEFVPGSPLERNLIGKYASGNGQYINLGREAFVMVQICLVKFDRRESASQQEERQVGDKKIQFEVKGHKDLDEWFTKGLDEGKAWRRVGEQEPFKGALAGKASIYEGLSNRGNPQAEPQPVRAYAVVFALSPELDVALVGVGPGDKKKWRTFESAYTSFAKTLQPVAVEALKSAPAAGNDPRSAKRTRLRAEIAKNPGWSLHETPNYFIVSGYDDKQFIEELKVRLEAIRLVYEKDYPPSLARKIRPRAPTEQGEDGTGPEAKGVPESGGDEPDPDQTVALPAAVDALELGRNSVVRLCKDRGQYLQYGGGANTGGYFNSMEEELVIFDDKQDEGRDHTWAVLNHEGFHQYIHAFFGNISPHSWYNEGTGDYYSGFEFNLKTKRFTAKKEIGRQDNLLLIREDFVPLKDFVRWSKAQYYGANSGNGKGGPQLAGWACYAQGWSLIWFLRTGAGKAKGWQESWGTILDEYLQMLVETGNLDKAVDGAFEGVDWNALEASWRDYMM